MFSKIKEQWKKEWIEKNRLALEQELSERKVDFMKLADQVEHENDKLKKALEIKNLELSLMIKTVDDRIAEVRKKDTELHQQIKLIEAKASPDKVWCEAFGLGFSKAWDMMADVQMDGLLRSRKLIEDQAISKAISGVSDA
jgi:uncharacterized protein YwqG